MPFSIRARLSIMMFLNYVIWGAWYVTLSTYLTATLHFTGTQAGSIFGTTALASMISPFFVGLVADRLFSTERVLATLHFIGAILLWLVAGAQTFGAVYGLLLAYCAIKAVSNTLPGTLPRVEEISLDGRVLFFTVGLSLFAAIIFGLAPALRGSRVSLMEVLRALTVCVSAFTTKAERPSYRRKS